MFWSGLQIHSIRDLPTRLSGWFSHAFSSSSTDLSLPSLLSAAACYGSCHLDRVVRYLLDSDAQLDRCADPIWLLGVRHLGYELSGGVPVVVVGGEGVGWGKGGARLVLIRMGVQGRAGLRGGLPLRTLITVPLLLILPSYPNLNLHLIIFIL